MLFLAIAVAAAIAADAPSTVLTEADAAAAFTAAGFNRVDGAWKTDCDQPDGPPYEAGRIEQAADLNGDGLPEAIITEGSLFCYGNTGTGFMLVSKQATGKWANLYSSPGMARLLPSRRDGWPEIEVGGPGFCYSIIAWNGGKFDIVRHEYEGKACRP